MHVVMRSTPFSTWAPHLEKAVFFQKGAMITRGDCIRILIYVGGLQARILKGSTGPMLQEI